MKNWLATTFVLVIGCSVVFAAINFGLDPYCIFHCKPERLIPIVTNERTTKYLFGFSYIPKNFDGVLVGSSISGNWNTAKIRGFRVYNASLSGGNAAEAELILNNVLDRGRMRLAIFTVHPAMGDGHDPKSGAMNPQEYWGSLGSIPLLQGYWAQLLVRVGRHRNEADAFGVYDISPILAARVNPVHQETAGALFAGQTNFVTAKPDYVDEIAFGQYQRLIAHARANGAKIVAVVPPRRSRPGQQLMHDVYSERLLAGFLPQDIIIDTDSPEFDGLRQNWENFWDGLHLTDTAADEVIEAINRKLAIQGKDTH